MLPPGSLDHAASPCGLNNKPELVRIVERRLRLCISYSLTSNHSGFATFSAFSQLLKIEVIYQLPCSTLK